MEINKLLMNHSIATYVDFVQSLGFVILIGFIAYSIKKIFLKVEDKVEKVEIKVER